MTPMPPGHKPSRTARIEIDFGDGTYPFALRLGELIELDEKYETGPMVMAKACLDSEWRAPWVRDIIRLGLVGGGLQAHRAITLVRRYVDEVPDWFRNAQIAYSILIAAINGVEVETPGKSQGAAENQAESRAPEAASPSPVTTMPPDPQASLSPN